MSLASACKTSTTQLLEVIMIQNLLPLDQCVIPQLLILCYSKPQKYKQLLFRCCELSATESDKLIHQSFYSSIFLGREGANVNWNACSMISFLINYNILRS